MMLSIQEKLFHQFRRAASFLDAEMLHNQAIQALDLGLTLPLKESVDPPALSVRALGRRFSNPIGMAAGFDKNAKVVRPLSLLGFGFVEVGSVLARPQAGNPKPRLFRLDADGAIINRMGLNSLGMDAVLANLRKQKSFEKEEQKARAPLGINFGLNKACHDPTDDYLTLWENLSPYADYVTFNISCPNVTQEALDVRLGILKETLAEIKKREGEDATPILIKISPDLTARQAMTIVGFALQENVDGLIVTNTTSQRPQRLHGPYRHQKGGLSGRPLASLSLDMLRFVARLSGGKLTLISCGGVASGEDVLERIRYGANLVELYTSFVFRGPRCVAYIKREMLALMQRDGVESLDEIRGSKL